MYDEVMAYRHIVPISVALCGEFPSYYLFLAQWDNNAELRRLCCRYSEQNVEKSLSTDVLLPKGHSCEVSIDTVKSLISDEPIRQ